MINFRAMKFNFHANIEIKVDNCNFISLSKLFLLVLLN